MTHSVATPDSDGSKSCGLICFGLIIILYTASNVTNEQCY